MASQTTGIQQLLAAEKKAAEQVNEARKRKARRLKQAKEEAQQEIEKYREQRERQFRQYESKHLGSRDDVAQKIETEAAQKMERIEKLVSVNKEQVIQLLLKLVCDVKPEIHRNVRHK
ncbi:V-type proton ATPase subunit [Trichinella spiralis]|uniref:V-type proton ATPase subunit G n=2 Tax=Trichinella spiralis TaxID=6334 RepID=E5SM81_TRISP|nr:vacuolar proton pump subunit G [Trichinella spiralis]KRY35572.1 V-type proton ATPase subunit G [Trichinella spiralis]